MYLVISGCLFLLFIGNIVLGSWQGKALLGDVGEMLLLSAVSISFVVAILHAERQSTDKE